MDDHEQFNIGAAAVDMLITAHKLGEALVAARLLTTRFPDRAKAWFWLALAAELAGEPDEALRARDAAEACADCDDIIRGDMHRDRLLSVLRRHRTDILFSATLKAIRQAHEGDTDRIACLRDVEGRHHYVCGRWQAAFNAHFEAHNTLLKAQWRFNNLFPFLKAMTMARQRKLREQTYRDIVAGCPPARSVDNTRYPGTRGILWRARLCRFGGVFGCRVDDLAEFIYWRVVKRA